MVSACRRDSRDSAVGARTPFSSDSVSPHRHVLDWLVRKPGAFAECRYRQDMFLTGRFRMAYETGVEILFETRAVEALLVNESRGSIHDFCLTSQSLFCPHRFSLICCHSVTSFVPGKRSRSS